MRDVLYKLAYRLMTSIWKPLEPNPERLYLYLTILRKLKLRDESKTLIEHPHSQLVFSKSLSCPALRRDIYQANGWLADEGPQARKRISHEK